jgi:hypothetical protein
VRLEQVGQRLGMAARAARRLAGGPSALPALRRDSAT